MNTILSIKKSELQGPARPLNAIRITDLPECALSIEKDVALIIVTEGQQAAVLKNRTGPVGVFPVSTVARWILGNY